VVWVQQAASKQVSGASQEKQVSPEAPQAVSLMPGRQLPSPAQQPAQRAVQSIVWPQLLTTRPHVPAQVVASLAQPQLRGVPPPPQRWPRLVQFWQVLPPIPQASSVVPS
jgi:hypothetical protein